MGNGTGKLQWKELQELRLEEGELKVGTELLVFFFFLILFVWQSLTPDVMLAFLFSLLSEIAERGSFMAE